MLTVNADDNTFMRQFHKPGKEKRTVIFIPDIAYQEWLNIPFNEALDFINWSADNQKTLALETNS